MKKLYTMGKSEVFNDLFHCSKILRTITDIGKISHIDYSKNVYQYKYEPKSSHFSNRQFSLHCTVKHLRNSHEYLPNIIYQMKQLALMLLLELC